MQLKTHLVITLAAILLFLPHVSNQYIFIPVAFIATFIPDIDSAFSFLGRFKGSRILQLFFKHRGVFHSLTFCALISIILAFFIPAIVFPFFLAYSLHLFADSFTVQGIRPFWPLKTPSKWRIKTGGVKETSLFVFLLIFDILLLIFTIQSAF